MSWRDRESKYGSGTTSRKGRGSRGKGSPTASFVPKTGDRSYGPQGGLYSQIQSALRTTEMKQWTVTSVQFVSRDAEGRSVYKVRYNLNGRYNTVKTLALDGGRVVAPNFKGSGVPSSGADNASTNATQDRWLKWLAQQPAGWASANEMSGMISMVKRTTDPARLNEQMRLIQLNGPFGVTATVDDGSDTDQLIPDLSGLGGGGGGGFAGPEYVAPDRRVVEDMAKGLVTALVGTAADTGLIKKAADAFMRDHRRNFDTPGQEISPEQTMLETIRNTEQYQTIHQLRPDHEDERSWISSRQVAAAQGGLDVEEQEDFAITQATVGGDLQDVQEAASFEQVATSGSVQGTVLEERLANQVSNVFRNVVR